MPLDFSKLGGPNPADTVTHPRQLFAALPRKGKKFGYPRDVQAEVWGQWYDRRDERDLVIKMNTGSGKTVVGLVILKSCLNEGHGPAVYVAPDRFLAVQVMAEARELGLDATDDPRDAAYQASKAILVTNIFKLINGKSVFGTTDTGIRIPIGSIVVDDAHACLDVAESQFTIALSAASGAYGELLALFKDDLQQQSAAGYLDVEAGDPTKAMSVPFWAWRREHARIVEILHANRDSDELKFTWALLKESLHLADGVFVGGRLEISSRCVPIDVVPSFAAGTRKVFLTATLADDSVLLTAFDVAEEAARTPITPDNANDLGERLILTPFESNPDLTEDELKAIAGEFAQVANVVVIVPSHERATYWMDIAVEKLSADNIEAGIAGLRAGHRGLVVIVNRYDGIDLADDACRLLILDRLPTARRGLDRIDDALLYGTDELLARRVQRIEQGMGRGIRSAEDWCVVILAGRSLTDTLYNQKALSKLTPGTRAQLQLSEQVADQIRGKPAGELKGAIAQVIGRDQGWVQASKAALVGVRYDRAGRINPVAVAQRAAFNAAQAGNYPAAIATLEGAANALADRRTKGWLKEQLAKAIDFVDQPRAQEVLLSASMDNRLVTRPVAGIAYQKLSPPAYEQAVAMRSYIDSGRLTANGLVLKVEGLVEQLQFEPDTAPAFEAALADLMNLLGFRAERTEKELGAGPDVLVALGGLAFLVVECKNGAVVDSVSKSDANQLAGSLNWFKSTYDASCDATPVLIHPAAAFDARATPPGGCRVIDRANLESLRDELRGMARGVAAKGWPPSPGDLAALLNHHGLTAATLITRFSVRPRKGK